MDKQVFDKKQEHDFKINQIRNLLTELKLDALLLQRVSSFAWATCGANSHINTAASDGVASLLITQDHKYVITNNIEASRLAHEEGLADQVWQFETSPWYEHGSSLDQLICNLKFGCDGLHSMGKNLSAEIAWLRSQLTQPEVLRFRVLASLCAESMQEAVDNLKPGMSEHQIAGLLAGAAESHGVQAVVNLVATDERIFTYRHPLPTDKTMQRYAMLILCGRKWGLICSITRLVYYGSLPEEIFLKSMAVANIDAAMIVATRPGNSLARVFALAQDAYQENGFQGEWQKHHQGGLAGYEPREITASLSTHQPVQVNQTYAWNPSISGAKSEDTILVGESHNEVLTEIPGWPRVEVKTDCGILRRPLILEKN